MVRIVNVKKTKKFKENRPENYHVHDTESPIGSSNHPSVTPKQQHNNLSMVMLNGKTYAPSSYVGSPRFTRMEKTARTTFSDREKYPKTKEVRLLLTLRLVSIIVTSL